MRTQYWWLVHTQHIGSGFKFIGMSGHKHHFQRVAPRARTSERIRGSSVREVAGAQSQQRLLLVRSLSVR
jgi:hypothetical protein